MFTVGGILQYCFCIVVGICRIYAILGFVCFVGFVWWACLEFVMIEFAILLVDILFYLWFSDVLQVLDFEMLLAYLNCAGVVWSFLSLLCILRVFLLVVCDCV